MLDNSKLQQQSPDTKFGLRQYVFDSGEKNRKLMILYCWCLVMVRDWYKEGRKKGRGLSCLSVCLWRGWEKGVSDLGGGGFV